LTVDFVVCTLAVKKKNQGRFRYVGSDHSLVSLFTSDLIQRRGSKGLFYLNEIQMLHLNTTGHGNGCGLYTN
jgi:hypothetical protein